MTDHRIFKYALKIQDEQTLELPVGSQILSVAEQRGKMVVYALVAVTDENMSKMKVKILIKGTGHVISENISEFKFLGTVKLMGGDLMFHVFYRG